MGGSISNPQDPGQPFLAAFLKAVMFLEIIRSNYALDNMTGFTLFMK